MKDFQQNIQSNSPTNIGVKISCHVKVKIFMSDQYFVCLLQEGDSEIAAKMQNLALAEGALPRHLHTAMYTQSTDNRLLTNRWG